MGIKEISVKQFLEEMSKKHDISIDKLQEMFDKTYEGFKSMRIPQELIEFKAKMQISSSFKRNPQFKFEGILLGKSEATDFGAREYYNEIKKMWDIGDEEVRKGMIRIGSVDEKGNPLWYNHDSRKIAGFKYQDKMGNLLSVEKRKVQPEEELRSFGYGIFKKEDTDEFKPVYIAFQKEVAKMKLPLFEEIIIYANGSKETEDGILQLYCRNKNWSYLKEDSKKIPYEKALTLIDKFWGDYAIDSIDDLQTWYELKPEAKIVFVKDAFIETVDPGEGRSGRLTLNNVDDVLLSPEDDNFSWGTTVWVPEGFKDYRDGTTDVIISATPNEKDGNISLQYLGSLPKFEAERIVMEEVSDEKFTEEEEKPAEEKPKIEIAPVPEKKEEKKEPEVKNESTGGDQLSTDPFADDDDSIFN